jgi:SWI/SNF-related matrix-associated actin-dependent regulator 1 of chromatin subfamily A
MFPNYIEYAQRYCDAKHNGFGWDFSGASNIEELHNKIHNRIMIRRVKKDVLKDLPDKIRSYIPIEINNSNDYKNAESEFSEFAKYVNRSHKVEIQNKTESLKQIAVDGKMEQSVQWIKDFLESDQKLVVFAWHKKVIDILMEIFKNVAVKVDGSITGDERQKAVDSFQNNPNIRLFIGNIKAAGVGITLTAASNVAFLELPWSPGDLDQAEDRCHRIGAKDTVNVYYLLAEGTIEEHIARMIDQKRKVVEGILDGKTPETESLLIELINQYSN